MSASGIATAMSITFSHVSLCRFRHKLRLGVALGWYKLPDPRSKCWWLQRGDNDGGGCGASAGVAANAHFMQILTARSRCVLAQLMAA